jgi:cysteine-rich repeat protein
MYSIDMFQAGVTPARVDVQAHAGRIPAHRQPVRDHVRRQHRRRQRVCDLGSGHERGRLWRLKALVACHAVRIAVTATVQTPPEQCDNGTNAATYGGASRVCGPSCQWSPYCGDGIVSNGEQCDEGVANGTGYGHCSANCTLGARCGDSVVQNPPEQCDDGIQNGATGDKCTATCTLKCGDGVVEAPEQCDNGAANNTGGYGKCNANCTLGPRCGDGIKNGTEQCDDGKNDGSYGTCSPTCTLAPYCGDGTVQNPPETCDKGPANSAVAY